MQEIAAVVKKELDRIPDRDRTFMRVTLLVIDRNAAPNAKFSDNSHIWFSYLPNIIYETSIPKKTYATFEKTRFRVDGSQLVPSKNNPIRQGYCSNNLCGANGKFTSYPVIYVNLPQSSYYNCPALTFCFDNSTDEYPKELAVEVLRNGAVIETVTVNPDKCMYAHFHKFVNFNGLRIIFKDMGKPYRRARLQYILFGARMSYTNDELITASKTTDVDPLERRLNEDKFSFEVINMDGLYNPANPNGIYEYLEDKLPIHIEYGQYCRNGLNWEDAHHLNWETMGEMDWEQAYEGGFYGWIEGGRYVLNGEPKITDTNATFSARDRLTDLTGNYTDGIYRPSGISLYDLAVEVLEDANISLIFDGTKPYKLNSGLKNIYTTAPMPKKTHAECLQLIAQAACMSVYTDRDGYIRIEPQSNKQWDEEVRFDKITSQVTTEKIVPIAGVSAMVTNYLPDDKESELHKADYTAGEYTAEFDFATDLHALIYNSFTIRATNSMGSDEQDFTMAITNGQAPVFDDDEKLPSATVRENYSHQIKMLAGTTGKFRLKSGRVPDHINISQSGEIWGCPEASSYGVFMVECRNAYGTAEKQFTMLAEPYQKPKIDSSSLPQAEIGRAYSYQMTAEAQKPVQWRLLPNDKGEIELPQGFTFSPNGVLSGTGVEEKSTSFTVEAYNDDGADSKSVSLQVKTSVDAPELSSSSVATGKVGTAYSVQFNVKGTPPYSFAIVGGRLPDGLSLNAATGVISGTPKNADNATFTLRVTDSVNGKYGDKDFTIRIEPISAPSFKSREMPNAVAGKAYSYSLDAGDLTTYKLIKGSLPPGLTLSSKGIISGTAGSIGVSNFKTKSGKASFKVERAGEVRIMGKKLNTSTEPVTLLTGKEGNPEEVKNPLITNTSAARALAQFALNYLKKRISCSFSYRGQPNIDCGDLIYTQTRYDKKFAARTLKHILKFDHGGLKGEMTVKRNDIV